MRASMIALAVALTASTSTLIPAQQPENPLTAPAESQGMPWGPPILIGYGTHVLGAAIDWATDDDVYEFGAYQGETVRLIVRSQANGLDPRIEIFDPTPPPVGQPQVPILDQFCFGENSFGPLQCTVDAVFTATVTGEHFIRLSDVGADETGGYLLQLERIPAPVLPPALLYSVPKSDTLDVTTDVDGFSFEGAGGSAINVILQSDTFGLDLALELRDAGGALLGSWSCAGENSFGPLQCAINTGSVVLPATGTYLLGIWDGGSDEVGSFTATVSCASFPPICPSAPPALYPGTGDDFELLTATPASAGILSGGGGQDQKAIAGEELVAFLVRSPGGTFDGAPVVVGAQLFATGSPPSSGAGGLWLDLSATVLLIGGPPLSPLGPPVLGPAGVGSAFVFPDTPALSGVSLLLQAGTVSPLAGNGAFALSDGHELQS